ncbi:unnamed protein product, partial [Tetraodon nigroviridis]
RNNKIFFLLFGSFTGLNNVRLLSLYDNQLSTILPGAFDTLPNLSTLNLLANPFNCDCRLSWFGAWLRSRRIVTGNPRCQSPAFLREIPLQDVAAPDFRCEDGTQTHSAQQGRSFRSADLCPAPRRRAGGGRLRPGPAVSQPVHVHGLGGSLQQQTPAGPAQRSAPERHRAVSAGPSITHFLLASHMTPALSSPDQSQEAFPRGLFQTLILNVLSEQVSGREPVHQRSQGVGNLPLPAAGVRTLLP